VRQVEVGKAGRRDSRENMCVLRPCAVLWPTVCVSDDV
jgi:hypothetical protein